MGPQNNGSFICVAKDNAERMDISPICHQVRAPEDNLYLSKWEIEDNINWHHLRSIFKTTKLFNLWVLHNPSQTSAKIPSNKLNWQNASPLTDTSRSERSNSVTLQKFLNEMADANKHFKEMCV